MRQKKAARRKWPAPLLLGLIFSGAALYLAFRNVPLADLRDYLGTIDFRWLAPAAATIIAAFFLRVVRWRFILKSVHPIGFWAAFHPLMIAFMMNCILPGRVGELARPVLLKKEKDVPFASGLATVAAERLFDMGLLLMLFLITVQMISIEADVVVSFGGYELNADLLKSIAGGSARIGLLLVAGLTLLQIPKTRRFFQKVLSNLPHLLVFLNRSRRRHLSQTIRRPLNRWIDRFAAGFDLVRSPVKLMYCLLLSALIWFLAAFAYYLVALGCPGMTVDFADITAVMVITCVFIALPSVPGYWGLWEAGGMFALALFGISAETAAGYTLVNHAIQILPVVVIGLISAGLTGVSIWKASAPEKPSPPDRPKR